MLITLNNISKHYGKKEVLTDVNLKIDNGETIGIVGANGSGKTTLIEIICGLIQKSGGEIKYDENFDYRRETGIQFQEGYWPKGITSKNIIKYFNGYFKDIKNSKWVQELIDIFEIREFIGKDLNNLSGGQKQRLNALLAIVSNPTLIILDELITGLDSKMQMKLATFFRDYIVKNKEKSLISITHMPEEVELMCERTILVCDGRIFFDDKTENIVKKYGSVRAFLNLHYAGKLESNLDLKIVEKKNISTWQSIKNHMKDQFSAFKPEKNTFKGYTTNWIKNFIFLFLSTFKNFRTYVYLFLIPAGLTLALYYMVSWTATSDIARSTVAGFLMIPGFAIILLMNTLISEWKASIFLKRIKVSGTSKVQFLSTIWSVGFVTGLLSLGFTICVLLIYGSTEPYTADWLYRCFDSLEFNGWIGILIGCALILLVSMGISTLISGSVSSIAVSQSISIIVTIVCILLSDIIILPESTAWSPAVVTLGYFIPQRYGAWTTILMSSGANLNWNENATFIFGISNVRLDDLTISFHSIAWPIAGGLIWGAGLFTLSIFTFSWSSKR
jgi:ABC-2 type transport system ATP-binding protein